MRVMPQEVINTNPGTTALAVFKDGSKIKKRRRYTAIYNHMTKMQGNQMETSIHTSHG